MFCNAQTVLCYTGILANCIAKIECAIRIDLPNQSRCPADESAVANLKCRREEMKVEAKSEGRAGDQEDTSKQQIS